MRRWWVVLLLLVGCRTHQVAFTGRVRDIRHIPAHTVTRLIPNGKTFIYVPQRIPDRWEVEKDVMYKDGRRGTKWFDVKESDYRAAEIELAVADDAAEVDELPTE
jgi:hypothetical protein